MRNFREYEIWKNAIQVAKTVYQISANFPSGEKFGLTNQLQRSSISISSNIAEGCGKSSEADFARILEIALGSSFETESQLFLACELGYIQKESLKDFFAELEILQKQIHSLINKLRSRK